MPASRVPCLTGPEDGTGGARRDACTALHGPSDDIGVGPHVSQRPNPREAWGQTLQLRQRTQADDRGRRISCHRTPCTLWRPGAPATGHSVPNPPRVVSYLSARLFSTNHRHIKGTAVDHHWRSPGLSRGLLGGVPTPNPQDHAQEAHYLPEVE